MTRPPRILPDVLTLALIIGCAGCIHRPRDISHTPEVRQLRLVGLCLELTNEAPLVEVGKPYRRLALERPSQPATGGPGKVIGTLPAGTRLRIVKVEKAVTYWDGLYTIDTDVAFARIDSGEHAGKIVDLAWHGKLPPADRIPAPFTPCPDTPARATPPPPP